MDANRLLVLIVALSSASFIVRAARLSVKATRGWIVVNGLVLGMLGALVLWAPRVAGYAGGSVWAVLVLLPTLLQHRVGRLSVQSRFREARRLASLLKWLHPADGYWQQPHVFRALEVAESGDLSRAAEVLRDAVGASGGDADLAPVARVQLFRMGARWEELASWVERGEGAKAMRAHPGLVLSYLRALGELGRLADLLRTFEAFGPAMQRMGPVLFGHARMMALAFGGRREALEHAFDRGLLRYPDDVARFWLATAASAAGDGERSRRELEALERAAPGALLRRAISWRRARGGAALPPPGRNESDVLDAIERRLAEEDRYRRRGAAPLREAWVTVALILMNLGAFALEWVGGGTRNLDVLEGLGAVVPSLVLEGQWWRLVAATFLHFGPLHLSLNMLALWFFGPFLELRLGRWPYALLYVASGALSMAGVVVASRIANTDVLLLGASGSIMGVIGATGVVLLRGYLRDGAAPARARLVQIGAIVVLQSLYDLATPEVSFLAHFGGALAGAGIALAWTRREGDGDAS